MIEIIGLLISVFAPTVLGFVVLSKDKKSHLNIAFALFNLSVVLWSISNYFSLLNLPDGVILFAIRATMCFAIWQSVTFFVFIHTFPNRKFKFSKIFLSFLVFVSLVNSIICFSPLVFSGIERNAAGIIDPIPNWGLVLFVLNSILLILIGAGFLIKKIRAAKGIARIQLNYILVGFILMFFLLIFFNFILVNFFHNTSFVNLGAVFTLPFILSTTYAIVRYRLMDIRTFFTRSLVYAGLVLFVTVAFVFSTYLSSIYLSSTESSGARFFTLLISSVVIILFLDPLKSRLAIFTNRIFFKASINYVELTKRLTNLINEEIDLVRLAKRLRSTLEKELELKNVLILLPAGEGLFILPEENDIELSETQKYLKIFNNSSLVSFLRDTKKILILEELDRIIVDLDEGHKRNLFEELRISLESIKAEIVLPIFSSLSDQPLAVIIFSKKISGDLFSVQDIELFEVIAPQVASGIKKAQLYQEQQRFGEELKIEVKKATYDLVAANKKLKELDEVKSEFMSIASHQLRTPLAGVLGYLSMIQDGDYGPVSPEQTPVIKDVLEATKRLIRMVNIFLNVTRIEAGRFVLNYSKVPFHDVVEQIYKELKPTADLKKVELVYEKTELPTVDVDPDKIKDVVLNLIDNAIKYSPLGKVKVWATANKTHVHVFVKDSGVGIPKDEAPNLFNKFTRGSGIARVEPNGSGLGLFIAKKITEAHGGRIWAESEGEGKGSTFQFEIPIVADVNAVAKAEEMKARVKRSAAAT